VNQKTQFETATSGFALPLLHSPGTTPVFILDNFRSAFNVGSAFRTAEAVWPAAVLLCGVCAVPGNRKLAHSARGTQKCLPWRYFDRTEQAVDWAAGTGRRIVALEMSEGSIPLNEAVFDPSDAFVFGNEALGIAPAALLRADLSVHFVQSGSRNCLNVSSILAIVAGEIQRRRILSGFRMRSRQAGSTGPGVFPGNGDRIDD
jgi:tRNA G18 (ribose-2'-O)-methylase SpoU